MAADNSWVFDSLVCFLHGPVWNSPIQNFIEEKSLIFDPNQEMDEISPEHRKIHEEYKNLVDYMLGSFMDEMHINPEQFEIACLEGRSQSSDNPLNFHQGLFQQIWAANNIKIFIRMMTQRNLELQLQALDLIERNEAPGSPEKGEIPTSDGNQLDEGSIEEEHLEEVISKSVEKELEHPETLTLTEGDERNFDRLNLFFENKEIPAEDLRSRQDYLRSRRDKILEIKKKVRVKQLRESTVNARPSSARVAQQILEGTSEVTQDPEKNSASLQLRKLLAKRLRDEVVEQH